MKDFFFHTILKDNLRLNGNNLRLTNNNLWNSFINVQGK